MAQGLPSRNGISIKKKISKKLAISPVHVLLGTLLLVLLILRYNFVQLGQAVQSLEEDTPAGDNQKPRQRQIINNKQEKKPAAADADADATSHDHLQPPDDGPRYQIIFSTGCSAFQDWQSYMFFFHASKILRQAQPPLSAMANTHVTRIASGCGTDQDAQAMHQLHQEQIEIMTPNHNFHLHITPDYSHAHGSKDAYKYFNKPYGTKDWMEHALGYSKNVDNKPHPNPDHDNDIVILLDPDQIMLRPFSDDFTHQSTQWRQRNSLPHWTKITHGQPFAQQYGFHNQWYTKTDISKIASPEELPSPLANMSNSMRMENFAAGPPYMATGHDMYRLVDKWVEFVVPTHGQYPHLLAEMFAYCLAAAHLNLPHQVSSDITRRVSSDLSQRLDSWPGFFIPFQIVDCPKFHGE
jgi:peptidyl serine alpha-galactosyltransferase